MVRLNINPFPAARSQLHLCARSIKRFPMNPRLQKQIEFLVTIDRLKQVVRRNYLADASRPENTAEHSWHLGLMAMVLAEHASQPIDTARAVQMVLVHDIIEIEAGDTFAYDVEANKDKAEREQKAAGNLFGLLPEDQAGEMIRLWEEFETNQTPEARFANALDRLLPLLQNYYGGGPSWKENQIRSDQVLQRNQPVREGSETLYQMAVEIIQDALERGLLMPPEDI